LLFLEFSPLPKIDLLYLFPSLKKAKAAKNLRQNLSSLFNTTLKIILRGGQTDILPENLKTGSKPVVVEGACPHAQNCQLSIS